MSWKVACIQFDITFGSPQENVKKVEKLIMETVQKYSPKIIVLPELWTTGYDLTRLDEIGDNNGDTTKKTLQMLAKKHNVHIVGGSVAKNTSKGTYNTMYTVNDEGDIVGEYSKLHLFQLMDEHLYLQPGKNDGLFQLDGETCAGVICYDIRFPEWIRTHTTGGAKVVFVVAEWPLPRLEHWRALLIARAIENQCYVVAANRVGKDPNNVFAGHSMIIDPWGEVLAEGLEDEAIVVSDIDLEKVEKVRKQIPIFEDRKPSYY
ncbi:carbon-nitrogen family hydrolase [Sutcliffiella cohnii]|uniref:carbon-nitrogen family hydrolase n=1 Tax=Sutcliffiella cohnii TaxID=33932 RepID=UPI002E229906|nr:carbon-nitrogen family hydrolase [Sutcliffiella cohnii]